MKSTIMHFGKMKITTIISALVLIALVGLAFAAPQDTATGKLTGSADNSGAGNKFTVNAYYSGDSDGTNSVQVSIRQCGNGPFGAANVFPHAAANTSPMVLSIPGSGSAALQANTCYDISVTFVDGVVTGTNPQYLRMNTTWDNTILHNANRFFNGANNAASNKYANGWGTGGAANYGQFDCSTCHTKSTTNIKRVKTTITAPSGSFPGGATNFKTTTGSGLDNFGADNDNHTISTRVCEVCHSLTNYHRYNTTAQAGGNSHNNNADCASICHPHNRGFVGAGTCDSCHGAPPGYGVNTADAGAPNGGASGSNTFVESHWTHYSPTAGGLPTSYSATTVRSSAAQNAYVFDCGFCHSNNNSTHTAGVTGTVYTNVLLPAGANMAGGNYRITAGAENGQHQRGAVNFVDSKGTCSSVYCHGNFNGGNNANVIWGTTAACGTCHGASTAAPPTGGSHEHHVAANNGSLMLDCTICHNGVATLVGGANIQDKSKHVNFATDYALKISSGGINNLSATYAGANSGSRSPVGGPYGQCANFYCHSNAQTSPPSGPLTYQTPTWGNAATGACGTCHGAQPSTGTPIVSGAHNKHINLNTTGAYNFACTGCHFGAGSNTIYHADRLVQVNIVNGPAGSYGGGNYSGTPAAVNTPYASCSSNLCHSNAAPLGGTNTTLTPGWSTVSQTCTFCHRGSGVTRDGVGGMNYQPTGNAATNLPGKLSVVHEKHLATDLYNFTCDECHANTVANNSTSALNGASAYRSFHVNGVKDVYFGTTLGSSAVNQAGGNYNANNTCTNLYCHSKGTTGTAPFPAPLSASAANWNPGSANVFTTTCVSCHGNKDTLVNVSVNGPAGAHNRHINMNGYNFDCDKCHAQTVAAGSSNVILTTGSPNGYANHVNGAKNVFYNTIGPVNQAGGNYATGASVTCNSTYCHSKGTTTVAPFAAPLTPTAAWNGGTLYCNGCHGTNTQADGAGSVNANGPAGMHMTHIASDRYNFTCDACHTATIANGSWNVIKNTSAAPNGFSNHVNGAINVQFTNALFYGGLNINMSGANVGSATLAVGSGNTTCNSTYCHSKGTTAVFPFNPPAVAAFNWNGPQQPCTICHLTNDTFANITAANSPSNSHDKHVSTDRYNFMCDKCHANTAAFNSNSALNGPNAYKFHVNGAKNVDFTPNFAGINMAGANYLGGNTTCNSTYCHSKGQSTTAPFTAPMTTALNWNGGVANCTSCHYSNDSAPNVNAAFNAGTAGSNKHMIHIATTYPLSSGATNAGYAFTCDKCHANTAAMNNSAALNGASAYTFHVNTVKDVKFARYYGANNGVNAINQSGGNYLLTTGCNTLYCHSKGIIVGGANFDLAADQSVAAVNWNMAPLGCNGCHGEPGTASGAPNYMNPASGGPRANSHKIHVSAPYSFQCYQCHSQTTDGAPNIMVAAHANGAYNVTGATLASYTPGTYSAQNGMQTGGTCATTCHGIGLAGVNAQPNPVWGQTTGCNFCHLALPTSGAHNKHVKTAAANYGEIGASTGNGNDFQCGNCHPNGSGAQNTYHVNGTVDVSLVPNANGILTKNNAGAAVNGGIVRNPGVSVVCNAAYCHSAGTSGANTYVSSPNWYGGAYNGGEVGANCAECHGNGPSAAQNGSNAHQAHVVGIHYDNVYNNSYGLAAAASNQGGGHGNSSIATTISCNLCHAQTIAVPYNDKGATCSGCHSGGGANTKGALNMTSIAATNAHLNGAVNVVFAATNMLSRSQIRDDITTIAELNLDWTRSVTYKSAANAYDTAKVQLSTATYTSGGQTCTNVTCHNSNSVTWTTTPACTMCHTQLP